MACVWRFRGNSVLSFYKVGPRNLTQVIKLDGKCLSQDTQILLFVCLLFLFS